MQYRKIYLAGPMTGLPDRNYPLFHRAAAYLRERDHFVYNPAERPFDNLRSAFAAYSSFILHVADTIVLLPGHMSSIGATAERSLARAVGLESFELEVRLLDEPSLDALYPYEHKELPRAG